jgi:hypothetical protein
MSAVVCGLTVTGWSDDAFPGDFDCPTQRTPGDAGFLAQMGGDDGPPVGGPFGHGGRRFGQQMKHLEQLRMLKMLELLDLDDNQEVEFLTHFNRMRTDQREHDAKIDAIVDTIATLVESDSPSDDQLNRLIDRSLALEKEKHEKFIEFLLETRKMLRPEQIGKLMVFHKRFESEILERLGRFREGKPGGPVEPVPTPPSEG